MGALHQVNATYYGYDRRAPGILGDAWGYALGAGAKILFPSIGPGDYLQAQVNYTVGAARYMFFTPNTNWGKVRNERELRRPV